MSVHYINAFLLWVIIVRTHPANPWISTQFIVRQRGAKKCLCSSNKGRDKELPLRPSRMHPVVGREKGARARALPLLTFPIFSSLSTLCKITFTSTPMRLYERCKHASNDFTLAAVLSSAIPRLYNTYQRLTQDCKKGMEEGGRGEERKCKRTFLPLREVADGLACFSRDARLAFMELRRSEVLNKFPQYVPRRYPCFEEFYICN